MKKFLLELTLVDGEFLEINFSAENRAEVDKALLNYWLATDEDSEGSIYYVNLNLVSQIKLTEIKECFKLVKDSNF